MAESLLSSMVVVKTTQKANFWPRENRKRAYAEIFRPHSKGLGCASPERKRRRINSRRPQLKRPYSEVARDNEGLPEFSSPERKRMRMDTKAEEKDKVLICTFKKNPAAMVQVPQKEVSSNTRSQSDTTTSDGMSRKKMREVDTMEVDMMEVDTMAAAKKIWIIGSSYIHRGEKAAHELYGQNFGLNATVQCFGKGGMRWSGVLPRFFEELAKQSPPDILVIHAGGNDLGLTPPRKLASQMQKELMQLHREFPAMTVLFSSINERQKWRYGLPQKINNDRKLVNALMRRAVGCFGGEVIEHPLLRFFKRELFLPDGVHFTDQGNSIFLTSIRRALNKLLQTSCPRSTFRVTVRQ